MKKLIFTLTAVLLTGANVVLAKESVSHNTIQSATSVSKVKQSKFVRATSELSLSISVDELKSKASIDETIISNIQIIDAKEIKDIRDNELDF